MAIAVLFLVVAVGFARIDYSTAAASNNPIGAIDYCTLENNKTTIYGWASDPNATSLTQPNVTITVNASAMTIPTSVAGYRDGPINNHLAVQRPNDKRPGTYGFKTQFDGLYKGSNNTIRGVALNVGPGSNENLYVNPRGEIDGTPRHTFSGGIIPQDCLGDRNWAPPPAPIQPAPAPSPPSQPQPAPLRPAPSAPQPAPVNEEAPQNQNAEEPAKIEASVKAGTVTALITVPVEDGTRVRIAYGSSPDNLVLETIEQPSVEGKAVIWISDLKAANTYSYQIIKIKGEETTLSDMKSFDTAGYAVELRLINTEGKPIKDVEGVIEPGNLKATSDSKGTMRFTGLTDGDYNIRFKSDGQDYQLPVTINDKNRNVDENSTDIITLDYSMNLSTKTTSGLQKRTIAMLAGPAILGSVALTALVLGVRKSIVRRNSGSMVIVNNQAYSPSDPNKNPSLMGAPSPTEHSPANPDAPHAGESLKDMVLKSMAEEAERRRNQG